MKKLSGVLAILGLVIIVGAVYVFLTLRPQEMPEPSRDANPSPTPQTQNTNPEHPLLKLEHPVQNQVVSSPLRIEGEARGQWFFEATFPVVLTNWDGLIIAEGYATAQDDWMTEDLVPFTAELTFTVDTSVSNRGSLILQKANPSGLPENDDAYEITVFFEE